MVVRTDLSDNLQAAPGNRSRFFVGGRETSNTARDSGGRDIPPAAVLERICRIQKVGAFKATRVGHYWNREGWGAVGPGEIVVEDEAVSGLVSGGGGELELPGVGSGFFPRNDELAGAETSIVDSRISGLVEETAGVDDSPVGVAEVQKDGRISKTALRGRPVGIVDHDATVEGPGRESLGCSEIIALEFTPRKVTQGKGAQPAAQIEGTPKQEGGARGGVPFEKGGGTRLPESKDWGARGWEKEKGEMIRIEKIASEDEVPRGQVADVHGLNDVEAGQTVGQGCYCESAITSRRIGGLENPSKGGMGSTRTVRVAAEAGWNVDKKPASIGIGSVVLHVDGVGSTSRHGEVVPEGPTRVVISARIA